MNVFLLVLIITGIVILGWKWMDSRAKVKSSPGYGKRMGVFYLFSAFTLLTSVATVLPDAIFNLLGLEKPIYFEFMAFAAFVVFCIAAVRILQNKSDQSESSKNSSVHIGGDAGVVVTKPKGQVHIDTGMVKKKF